MGDSICFCAEVVHSLGWGSGLAEDFEFRQLLLLEGIRIGYEPRAKGYGEAPANWKIARGQRARWLRGSSQASRKHGRELLKRGLQERNAALLDGAYQAYMPSFSTLTLLLGGLSLIVWLVEGNLMSGLSLACGVLLAMVFCFPYLCLFLDQAPPLAYLAILSGPLFMVWRTLLSIQARFLQRKD